jgi:hypothetical protein
MKMGNDVLDYRVEFNVIDDRVTLSTLTGPNLQVLKEYQELTTELQREVVVDVELQTENSSYRTFFIKIDALHALEANISKKAQSLGKAVFIAMNIDAVGPTANLTYNTDDLRYIPIEGILPKIAPQKDATFFAANTTTLIEITISRMADDKIFAFVFDQGAATPAAKG